MQVPHMHFKLRIRDEAIGGETPYRWHTIASDTLFSGRHIILTGLAGAFNPTCSTLHLPDYEKSYDQFKALGIDEIFCLSVNDPFVMQQWADSLHLQKIQLLPDGSGEFTRKIGMLVRRDNLGFGYRSWRYVAYIKDGVIVQLFPEAGLADDVNADPYHQSAPDIMMTYLKTHPIQQKN